MLTPRIHLPEGWAIPALDPLITAASVEVVRWSLLPAPGELDPERAHLVLVPGDRLLATPSASPATPTSPHAVAELAQQAAIVALVPANSPLGASDEVEALLSGVIDAGAAPHLARIALRAGLRQATTLRAARHASQFDARDAADVRELARVGVALSTERDLDTLLDMILAQARRIAAADAGSIFLVVRTGDAPPVLRFKLTQNDTLPELPLTEFEMPIDSASLAGHCAVTREAFRIDDVYELDPSVPYRFNRSFDERTGYRTKSMLVIPMQTHLNEVVGVVQLINQKRHAATRLHTADDVAAEVVPFDLRSVEMVEALASQAGVAIENSRLYEDIERLFEGFVTAAVTAIESRDPTTSGHSWRVATLTCTLAEAVDRGSTAGYRDTRFSREQLRELRYAGLLHDFGKVGVREQVLVKQKKLYPGDLALVKHRFQFLLQQADLQFERDRAEYLYENGRERYDEAISAMHAARRDERDRLHRFLDTILQANEPTVLPEGTFHELHEINAHTFVDFDGTSRPLLGDDELRYLMIDRGNLDPAERREIESHVTHTFRFLDQIPWTAALKGIPTIAYGHHEKLNGAGYPRQLTAGDIPVQTRMMTISDIYDALTATDRPYKRAVPLPRALDILRDEAATGAIDSALLQTFIDAKVFESVREDVEQRRSGATPSHGVRAQ